MTGVAEMGEETGRIGRYATRRVLGSGAFATVWLGRDDELDVPVAIKVLADNWTHNGEVRARFVEEARILRRISDSRVIGVHDIGTLSDGRSYFVMDYADGGTLADKITDRPGGLDRGDALAFGVEVAQAVQVLHEHGVLHRDVKPSNLLLRRRPGRADQLMVADLGTAKALAEASGLTMASGTPAYMAPEQAHGRWGLDERADVYGLGAVTYALLTGRAPFVGEQEITQVAFRDPRRRAEPLDDGGPLDALLGASLAFDPDERPASAHEFADRLLRIAVDDARARGDDRPTHRFAAVSPAEERTQAQTQAQARVTQSTSAGQPTTGQPTTGQPTTSQPTRVSFPESDWSPATQPAPVPAASPASFSTSTERRQPDKRRQPDSGGLGAVGLIALAVIVFVVVALAVWFGLSLV